MSTTETTCFESPGEDVWVAGPMGIEGREEKEIENVDTRKLVTPNVAIAELSDAQLSFHGKHRGNAINANVRTVFSRSTSKSHKWESPLERLDRLKSEVQSLLQDMEEATLPANASEQGIHPADMVTELKALAQQLEQASLPSSTPKQTQKTDPKNNPSNGTPSKEHAAWSALDRRLAPLEHHLSLIGGTHLTSAVPLTHRVKRLETMMALLDPEQLDALAQQAQVISRELETVYDQRESGVQELPEGSLLDRITMGRIDALHALLPDLEATLDHLPLILDRLAVVQSTFASSSDLVQRLNMVEQLQTSLNESLAQQQQLLEALEEKTS